VKSLRGAFAVMVVIVSGLHGCVGPVIAAQGPVVRADIDKAKQSGAVTCTPRELAMAEAHVDFAENELAQGDFQRAEVHMKIARDNAVAALAGARECAPKTVVVKARLDQDGDGLFDDIDACPEQPEDHDLFEDEDGCPEPDNDKDETLDALDACPNTPGPKDNNGCRYGDRDGDGVHDKADACPDAAEDNDGERDADGRPDVDVDGDRGSTRTCSPSCGTRGITSSSRRARPIACGASASSPPTPTRMCPRAGAARICLASR
jgi:hypothetical protein